MKSYLCIGGPLHGSHKSIEGRQMLVPRLDAPEFHFRANDVVDVRCREERYEVKEVELNESKQSASFATDGIEAIVSVRLRVQALVHESVLTVEEVGAWYRKLAEKTHIRHSIRCACDQLTLGR